MHFDIASMDWTKISLFVATPMYGGQCCGAYTAGMIGLQEQCSHKNIKMHRFFLVNESLITRARNLAVAEFLDSGASHLLFIDADIGFAPSDVLTMMTLMAQNSSFDIMAASYPLKQISWDRVREGAKTGASDLSQLGSRFVVNLLPGTEAIDVTKPTEVMYTGTGFMMISRSILNRIVSAYPESEYLSDQPLAGSKVNKIHMFFQADIDPVTKRYLSEDYWFCQRARSVGAKIFICPWMKLDHLGNYSFSGSLAHFAGRQISGNG